MTEEERHAAEGFKNSLYERSDAMTDAACAKADEAGRLAMHAKQIQSALKMEEIEAVEWGKLKLKVSLALKSGYSQDYEFTIHKPTLDVIAKEIVDANTRMAMEG